MKEVNGNTKILGIIGKPVKHTLSPRIHNFLAQALGHDLVYLPFEVDEDIHAAIKGAYALGIVGMNVTVPYKSAVIAELTEVESLALKIGAVNTLVRTIEGYRGYNTDILGLKRELTEEGISLKNERVIIVGAGGAARATAFLCAKEGTKHIYILNRSLNKARALAEDINRSLSKPEDYVQALELSEYEKLSGDGYIAFQCTSVGLSPNVEEVVIEDKAFYQKLKAAVDLIYTPQTTRFMKLAAHEGCQALNGMRMLIYQAVASYELWTGVQIEKSLIDQVTTLV